MDRSGIFETVVGMVVIAVAAGFMVYAYGVSGRNIGANHYRLEAVFGQIDGITVGSEVRIAGVKIGSVAANTLNPKTYEADVALSIDTDVQIPEDSVAKIVSDGFLGGAHVSIEPGASEEMMLEGEKITITQGSVDLLGIAVKSFTSQSKGSGKGDDDGKTDIDPLGDL